MSALRTKPTYRAMGLKRGQSDGLLSSRIWSATGKVNYFLCNQSLQFRDRLIVNTDRFKLAISVVQVLRR